MSNFDNQLNVEDPAWTREVDDYFAEQAQREGQIPQHEETPKEEDPNPAQRGDTLQAVEDEEDTIVFRSVEAADEDNKIGYYLHRGLDFIGVLGLLQIAYFLCQNQWGRLLVVVIVAFFAFLILYTLLHKKQDEPSKGGNQEEEIEVTPTADEPEDSISQFTNQLGKNFSKLVFNRKAKDKKDLADWINPLLPKPFEILMTPAKFLKYLTQKPVQLKKWSYFQPTEHFALLISNVKYDKVRRAFPGFQDVEPAVEDIKKFKQFLTNKLHVRESNMIHLHNATNIQMRHAYILLKKKFKEAHDKKDKKLCLWVYYAGHGVMVNKSYIVLNESVNKEIFYPLEHNLQNLTLFFKNTCAITFWDCCRQQMDDKVVKQQEKIIVTTANRGNAKVVKNESFQNLINVYATMPNEGVSINSTFADNIYNILSEDMLENGGVLRIPDAFKALSQREKSAIYNSKCNDTILIDVDPKVMTYKTDQPHWVSSQLQNRFENKVHMFPDHMKNKENKQDHIKSDESELSAIIAYPGDEVTKWQFELSNGTKYPKVDDSPSKQEIRLDQNKNAVRKVDLYAKEGRLVGIKIEFEDDERKSIGDVNKQRQIHTIKIKTKKILGVCYKIYAESRPDVIDFQFIVQKIDKLKEYSDLLNFEKKKLLESLKQIDENQKLDLKELKEQLSQKAREQKLQEVKQETYTGFVNSEGHYDIWGVSSRDGQQYEGRFKDGKKFGLGKETYPDSSSYEGPFKNEKPHGFGKFTCKDKTELFCEWKDGQKANIVKHKGKTSYAGETKDGLKHGMGSFIDENGNKYTGHFVDDKRQGLGELTELGGSYFIGHWENDEIHQGVQVLTNGEIYTGDLLNRQTIL